MPDKRMHRGQHPADFKLFADDKLADIRSAVADFSLLLTKGYAEKSALKLVGDKFSLTERQRIAVMRSSCSDEHLRSRKQREVEIDKLRSKALAIDGYNILITLEAAISGGLIFKGRDGCFRDLASIHGTYRKVTETIPALQLIAEFLKEADAVECLWLLDSPVSNSGRLKGLINQLSQENSWPWQVELLPSPDSKLIKTDVIVASSDGIILNGCKTWLNLARAVIESKLAGVNIIDMSMSD
ncbi:MAG: DUF434 domain-containing protein [Sedimentisphaerales bacterium]|nr:DUF434 domain-containing protein [Sedimentisphaerales bacterium]